MPALLVTFLQPVLGWLARGFVAGHDAGRGLTRQRCDRPELKVGLSTTVLRRSASRFSKGPNWMIVIGIDPIEQP